MARIGFSLRCGQLVVKKIFQGLYSHVSLSLIFHPSLRCSVNIPITFIFRDGSPIKCLTTNPESGLVERINLNSPEYLERQRGEKGLQGESMKLFRVLRKLLLQFSLDHDYGDHQPLHDTGQNTDLKLCHVCYTDGEVEDLTIHAFDRLIRSETWRLQVLLVQGYVPTLSQHDGFYSDKPKAMPLPPSSSPSLIALRSAPSSSPMVPRGPTNSPEHLHSTPRGHSKLPSHSSTESTPLQPTQKLKSKSSSRTSCLIPTGGCSSTGPSICCSPSSGTARSWSTRWRMRKDLESSPPRSQSPQS